MRNLSKKPLALLLAILMCLSMLPVTAMAATDGVITEDPSEISEAVDSAEHGNGGESLSEPAQDEPPAPTADETPAPSTEPTDTDAPDPEETQPIPGETPEPTDTAESDGLLAPENETPEAELPLSPGLDVTPIMTAVVNEPLIKVVFRYGGFDVATPTELEIESAHSYYALGTVSGDALFIPANMFPDRLPIDVAGVRVWLDGNMDITIDAQYDSASGLLTLPARYLGHRIRVEWNCPVSDIMELPVTVTVNTCTGGAFTEDVHTLSLASNASEISVPVGDVERVVVSQNGVDLAENAYHVQDGTLIISASSLGGDLAVTAYSPAAPSKMLRSMNATQVRHTRSADQIYYGYYTSYYTANGNVAFCLDPTVSGLNAGTYAISYWLNRSSDALLIKCAYYLYGGPGYDSVKYNLFDQPDTMAAYGLSHAAASYAYLGSMEAFKGLSSSMSSQLINLVNYVGALPMPPQGFDCFVYNVGSGTNQCLMGWEYSPVTPEPEPEPEPEPDPIVRHSRKSGQKYA